jgi:beta-mannanase
MMKRREFLASAIMAVPAFSTVSTWASLSRAAGEDALLTKAEIPAFGAYDPYGDFSSDKSATIEHLFLPWEDVDLSTLPIADEYALARGRDLLITIEPWTWSADWRISPSELQTGILSGRYDANMLAIVRIVATMKSRTTIRWAHEMEDKTGRFTWAGWKPEGYIAAYHRMIDLARKASPRTHFMWSPKGEDGLEAYYPGDDYADLVGLSVFGLQKWDKDKYGRNRTFSEVFKPGYMRTEKFGKPIVVAELGYVGDAEYVAQWDADSRRNDPEFPAWTAVTYFNQKEVAPWPDGYGLPDWRVRHNIIA